MKDHPKKESPMFKDGVCDCSWLGTSGVEECGCGETHARLYRDDVVHWRGKHWCLECAFRVAERELQELQREVKEWQASRHLGQS